MLEKAKADGDSCHMAGVKEFYLGVRRSLNAAAVILAFDVGFFGSIHTSSVFCPIWILVSSLKSAIRRPGWGLALARVGIPALTFWLVRVNNDFQISVAKGNAQRVVAACENYHAANGRFPTNLDELVPQYMQSVPLAKYCLGPGSQFSYYHAGKPMLVWEVVSPHFRRTYDFETRRWSDRD